MCGRFVLLTYDQVEQVVREIMMESPINPYPDWPARPMARPGSVAPIIVSPEKNTLDVNELQWGFTAPWDDKKLVFNTRLDTAIGPKPGMWESLIEYGRCVIATGGFFEPHKSQTEISPRSGRAVKRQYEFSTPGDVTLLGGVSGEGCFSVVTTAPNEIMSPIHDRMPLVLERGEVSTWLWGDYKSLSDRGAVKLVAQPEQATDTLF